LVYYNQSNRKRKNSVYTATALPFNLLNFISNFGTIKAEDERKYIESMFYSIIKWIYPDNSSYENE
jgi:hypothetical protein